ncbi:hypothetical protein QJV15_07645 [Listeria cossartiae subsp. cayugensis]|uniref:hypothetical protein n=1 Tax=Listeria cossartiae TaxID=2838249 RepID=UPI00287FF401|nr:hypothetical protein [Listeria cossartiae]MDT0000734.1 hypothetical protein [Listeria cossartiae subsp. cayugensis]MDT0009162.1 hypothetical protein [Listeria cossartiae subsp. cayugensis]MDT0030994.1 hypothetical protein [Listeria cossartiae subsp. cayugensis]MDT0039109.1 hypothetical protein [Listeria cossartiae subsp. cayugensis]MDT0044231.1 hypothetical protein [Listeria cossartiae subsp. cayugensis]
MNKQTQMNREIFQINLGKTLKEIMVAKGLQNGEIRFVIVPVEEKGKMLDGSDEMMKRLVLTKENIGNKQLVLNDVVDVLGGLFPKAPIWINVSFLEVNGEKAIFKLETSLRFRKPTLLRNAETRHAPFKAIT